MAYIDDLKTRRDKVAAELAAIDSSKPNYSIDGESVNHADNRRELFEELEKLNTLITKAAGPWVIRSRGKA